MRFNLSIQSRLTFFIMAFVVMILGLSAVAATTMMAIDRKSEAVDQKWLASTQLLGELLDRISEFRIAETYRALAVDAKSRSEAELLATEHRRVIELLQATYEKLHEGEDTVGELAPFRTAWGAYLSGHNAWVNADPDGALNGPAQFSSELHHLYVTADLAVDALVGTNADAAHAEANNVDGLVDGTIVFMIGASTASLLFAAWLVLRIRSNVTQPLGAITQALSSLASGDRDVQVPEVNRSDEIGEMAKAFDVFRANSFALKHAHEATRLAQEQAQSLARHDVLTGLPNRRVFSAELQTALAHARSEPTLYSVLMIDLDRFKPVNDLQGHAVGDLVLCEVARRLMGAVRKNDTVARLGGDEFAIIAEAEPQTYPDHVIRLAGRILAAIREPIIAGETRIEIGASIGIATCPVDGSEPDVLLHAADLAMYRAKRDGRGTFRFFEQSMDEELRAQAALEVDLRKAIPEGTIEPHYQPLMDMHDNRIYGFEMLARWRHHERGAIPPDIFIPLAEQLGLIPELTWSLLRRACRDAKEWPEEIRLSINISPIQLKDPALPAQLLTMLSQEGFSPARLEVEITETALVSDIETAKLILTALQSVGIKVSLDDFGTGYSSLYHLRELKFDKVKIDRSFIQSMANNSESEKIVDAILSLAKSLGLPTVAEGIESESVLHRLTDMGCEFGQGYYFGRAMTASEATELLNADKRKQYVVVG